MNVFKWDSLKDFSMIRIPSIPDGSCYFHALLMAFYVPYIKMHDQRTHIVKTFRMELSRRLSENINPDDTKTPVVYETLSRGSLKELSKDIGLYSLDYMKKELEGCGPVSHLFNEFISNEINKDIYILDMLRREIYPTGDDYTLIHKGRPSIVLLYFPGHYDLVGLVNDRGIETLFSHEHPFIKDVRRRYSLLCGK